MQSFINWSAFPAVRLCLLISLGILLANSLQQTLLGLNTTWLVCWLITLLMLLFEKYAVRINHAKRLILVKNLNYSFLLVFFAFSVHLQLIHHNQQLAFDQKEWGKLKWEEVSISGKVVSHFGSNNGQYVIRIDTILRNNQYFYPSKVKALVSLSTQEKLSTSFDPKISDRIYAICRILPEPENESLYKEKDRFIREGIALKMKIDCIYKVKSTEKNGLIAIREAISRNLERAFEGAGELGALSFAMVLAQKSNLDKELKELFARTGLSHILAVSGLHVGMIILPLWWFMPHFWLSEQRKWLYLGLCSTLMLIYVFLTAYPASVQRASIMAFLLLIGRLWHRNGPPINLLATAAILMWIIDPSTIFDIGFHLSFFAVGVIFLVYQPFERNFISAAYKQTKLYRWILSPLLFTTILQLAMLPITLQYFGYFPLVGPLANFVFLPALSFFLFPLFIFLALTGYWIPTKLLSLLVVLSQHIYRLEKWFLINLEAIPFAIWQRASFDIWEWSIFLLLILFLNSWSKHSIRWVPVKLLLGVLILKEVQSLFL